MGILVIWALLSGVAWGTWPLIINKSGLNGSMSAFTFSAVVLVCTVPFAFYNVDRNVLANANWTALVIAGVCSTCGLLMFNGMLAKATPQNVGTLIVIMAVAQAATPTIYQVIMDGHLSLRKAIGFAAAFTATILLTTAK